MPLPFTNETNLSRFIKCHLDRGELNYRDVAVLTGYSAANIIYSFADGTAKLPIDRVSAMAQALGCDAGQLMVLTLESWFDRETFERLRELFISPITVNQRAWLTAINHAAGEDDPAVSRRVADKLASKLNARN